MSLHHLLITVLSSSQANITQGLAELASSNECQILEAYARRLGEDAAGMYFVVGSWHKIAKLEAGLVGLQSKFNALITSKRVNMEEIPQLEKMPYIVQVVAPNRLTIIGEISNFFVELKIDVSRVDAYTYQPAPSRINMLHLQMRIELPLEISIADVREQFLEFCDALNIDAIMEPDK